MFMATQSDGEEIRSELEAAQRDAAQSESGLADEQLDLVARAHEVNVRQGRGSHVVFEHPKIVLALSVPARRPIKPVYVRRFVGLIDAIEGSGGSRR